MKIHLQRVDDPLKAGEDVEALCGAVVTRAMFPLIVDTAFEEAITLNSIACCARCYAIRGKGKYVYALAPGQEAMTAEVSA